MPRKKVHTNVHNIEEIRRALQQLADVVDNVPQNAFEQTTIPGAGDDITQGWDIGSLWVTTSAVGTGNDAGPNFYENIDSTEGAAVWRKIVDFTVSAGGGVAGPGFTPATDNQLVRLHGTIGKVQGSKYLIGDNAIITNTDTGNLLFQMGDNAGASKFSLTDSDTAEVFAVDSNGNVTLLGTVDGRDVAVDGSVLDDHDTVMPFYDGASRDTISIIVVQNGAGVDLHLEADGGGDLRFRFDNVEYTLDTTPALVIPLNVGTDTVPVENYIYVTESGGTLSVSVSTSEFPETPHAKIATVDVQSAASVGTDGPYEVHAHTDHVVTASGNGHLDHINEKLRSMHATWLSGVAPADLVVVTTDGYLSIPTGKVRQLHKHTVPARDMQTGDPAFVINEPGTPYNRITSLASITQDSEGNTVTNKYINLVLWGVVSQVQADCKMFLSLPSGVYVTEANAIIDAEHTANYSIPTKYTGTAFMIARYTLKRSGSNVWSQSAKEDLRGLFPSTTAGGGSVSGEANTASNVGTAGVGVFKQKTSVDLEFKNINAGSAKITITDDTGDDEIDIDLGSVAITDLSDVSAKTGTGSTVVMDTSPTLITPTISSFANSNHGHADSAGGGTIDHGALTGRGDDDHTGYLLADGTRNMGGNFFIVDSFGFVIGHTSKIDFGATPEFQVLGTNTSDASMGFARFEDNTSGPDVRFLKSRAAAIGDNVIVQDGDTLGRFRFQGADGVDFNTTAAEVLGQVDGAPSENDIPGRIIFKTRIDDGALTEKMRLDNQGRLGIGTTPATSALLDLASTTGAILIPRMTTTQRDALTAVNAMMIYNSTLNKFQSYENSDWVTMIGGGGDVSASANMTDNSIVRGDGGAKGVQDSSVLIDDNDNMSAIETATFNAEHDNGNSGTSKTIDFNNGQFQKVTLTGNVTYTFTAPIGPGTFILKVDHGGGGFTQTFPATVKWEAGTVPTWSAGASAIDLIAVYYDGTNYYCGARLDNS